MRFALCGGTIRQEKERFFRYNGVIQRMRVMYHLADRHRRVRMRLVIILETIEQIRLPKSKTVESKRTHT